MPELDWTDDQYIEVPLGGVWEYDKWHIVFNYTAEAYAVNGLDQLTWSQTPCPHAFDLDYATYYSSSIKRWKIPRTVVAFNEGGYCTTGVCLDCIIAWAEEHPSGILAR